MLLYPTACASCRREIRITERRKCVMRDGVIVSCPQCKTKVSTEILPFTLTANDMRFLRSIRIRAW